MSTAKSKWLLAGIIFGVPLLLTMLWWPGGLPPPRPPLPVPNGYDDFLAAIPLLDSGLPTDREPTEEEYRGHAATNAAALAMVRSGLTKSSHVHTDYGTDLTELLTTTLPGFRRIERVFDAEARTHQADQATNRAILAYLELAQFAHASTHGGVIIEHLIGFRIGSVAMRSLAVLRSSAGAEDCRLALRTLLELERGADSLEDILSAERRYGEQVMPFWGRVPEFLSDRVMPGNQEAREKFVQRYQDSARARQMLLVDIAVRLFELEHGKRPAAYSDLVPLLLPSAPIDPATGRAFAYPF